MQAETWAEALSALGHHVEMINPWGHYDWKSFDVIHFFGFGAWLEIVPALAERTASKFVISPIIDTNRSHLLHKIASYCGIPALHMTSPVNSLRRVRKHVSMFYARSDYEKQYLNRSLDVDLSLITNIPLAIRLNHSAKDDSRRDPFCLHVSLLSSENKNVMRLIDAAIKHKFRLVLAGNPGTEQFKRELLNRTNKHDNIEVLGYVSEWKLEDLYATAKVFALPSTFEGVGLVALEAAALGADVVITNRGAPKEYYDGMAFLVNPFDMDDIGKTIAGVIEGKTHQPRLRRHVLDNYSSARVAQLLEKSYLDVTSKK